MKSIIMRADKEFKQMVDRVRNKRRQEGKDKRDLSDRRLTLAISRITNIEKLLIDSKIKDDNRFNGGIQ